MASYLTVLNADKNKWGDIQRRLRNQTVNELANNVKEVIRRC